MARSNATGTERPDARPWSDRIKDYLLGSRKEDPKEVQEAEISPEFIDFVARMKDRANHGQVTAFHVLNDNNLFNEKRFDPYAAGGRPFKWHEKPVRDMNKLIADVRARSDAGDAIATDILREIGDR